MTKDDITVTVEDGVLYLRGEQKREETIEEDGWQRTESYYGQFSRAIPLAEDVDADAAEARLDGDVLTLRLPKRLEGGPQA
jgi:HSP20 family protein